MLRKNSSSKWKQVLGFDDGATLPDKPKPKVNTAPPPPAPEYSDMPEVVSDMPEVVSQSPVTISPSSAPYPRLPRDITFYRKKHKTDFLLAPSPPAPSNNDLKPLPSPPHLFYITIQQDESPWEYTRKPDIIIHTGPSQSSPILSYVEFHTATMKADITLCPYGSDSTSGYRTTNYTFPSPPPIKADANGELPKFKTERLSPMGGIFTPEKYAFCHTLPRSFVRERFEWRYSSGPFIRTGDGQKESGGLKLIRVTTGETVAVYAGLGNVSNDSSPVVGMFRFLAGESLVNLGEEFEILAVLSILTVVEKQRRAVIAS
ncbi:hypothetical protein LSUE1_G005668, partial [Lachnellula suecica]